MKKVILSALVVCMLLGSLAFAGEKVVYEVKKGDTLDELSYYWRNRQGVEVEKLFVWNSDLGMQVQIGQKIVYYLPDRPLNRKEVTLQEIKKVVEVALELREANQAKAQEPTTKQQEKSLSNFFAIFAGISTIIILIGCVLGLRMNRRKQEETKVEEKKQLPQERWIPGKAYDGIEYSIRVMQKATGECVAPFYKKGTSAREERDNYQAMKKCVRLWMKNPKNEDEFLRLVAAERRRFFGHMEE